MKFHWFQKLWRRQRDEELDAEIRSHLDEAIRDRIARGETPDEARANALREFGNVGLVKEVTRAMWGWVWLEQLMQDLQFGWRMLRKNSSFSLVALITLALGIGANTVIFSVINSVLLRPLPYHDPDKLIVIRETKLPEITDSQVSPAAFLAWQKQNTVFAPLEAVTVKFYNLNDEANPERVKGMPATHGVFPMLGLMPMIGRNFLPEEHRPGHNRVVILSHVFWQRRFGGEPNILGRTIRLDDQPHTVIGVLPPQTGLNLEIHAVWTPLAFTAEQAQQHDSRYLFAFGRLKPGVTLNEAKLEMNRIADHLAQQFPDSNTGWQVKLLSLHDYAADHIKRMLAILLGAVGFVLLIACANVANLLLARAAARQKELAIRVALGAGRWRIVRQLLAESLLLSLAGGMVGATLAHWGVKLLWTTSLMNQFGIRKIYLALDGRMLAFNLLVVLLTGCLVGMVPAWQSSRPNLNNILKDAGRGSTDGRRQRFVRNALVVSEVALSMVLLIGAGLMLKSVTRLLQVDPGFQPENVRTIAFSLPKERYSGKEQQAAFYTQLIERVAALPGVQVAGAACAVPFSEGKWDDFEEGLKLVNQGFRIEGQPPAEPGQEPHAWYSSVSPDYFKAIGIPLLRGRHFTERDAKNAPPVVIINQTMARKFFPDEDPIGQRIQLTNRDDGYREIVGVAGDVKPDSLGEKTPAQIYESYLQQPFPFMTLVLRVNGDPTGRPAVLNAAIRAEIQKLDRTLPVVNVERLDESVWYSTNWHRSTSSLLGVFATVAVGLAAVGLYGVMSYLVTRRTQEIGIRMALGAQPADVLRLILRQGARLTLSGVAAGALAAWALMRLLRGELHGVITTDPFSFIGAALLLSGVALLACFLPARRATKVDPLIALRHE